MGRRYSAIDGIRAISITLIVMSHTQVLSQGGLGNAIFFCLSGFFATFPFADEQADSYFDVKKTILYYTDRLIRVLPAYYFVILFFYFVGSVFFKDFSDLIHNIFFIECSSHLWFLQQMLLMYFFVPFIYIVIRLIKKNINNKYDDFVCAVVLFVIALLTYYYLTADVFWLNGNNAHQKFRIEQFLVGFSVGYLYKGITKKKVQLNKAIRIVLDSVALAFILFCILSAEQILSKYDTAYSGYYIGWEKSMLCSVLSGAMVLSVLINTKGIIVKILSFKPIAYIGKISFSIYLIHMFLIPYFYSDCKISTFILVYFFSICFASVMYVVIEKPSMIYSKTKSMKSVIEYYRDL